MICVKKFSIPFLVVLLLIALLVTAGCSRDAPGAAPPVPGITDTLSQPTYTSNETLVAFVESAAAYVKENGRKKALAEFNNRNGSFIKGELYIFAYDFNGTTLAHPVNPESVGKIRSGANGIFVTEMAEVVRNGDGFYRFVYINPLHNNTLESKMGYGVQAGDDWWLGSGVYTGPADQISAARSIPARST
jgi:signal transduction histidine kinase